MRHLFALFAVVLLFASITIAAPKDQGDQGNPGPPNIVLILTDNHSPWTLGCYGNRDIRTPHIDRLAAEGVLFERAYSCNAVCSPSRASLLTGLMPSQHGVHRYLGAGEAQMGPNAWSTMDQFTTLPEILHDAGYVCGLSGKWHLGLNTQPQEGFTFWITKPTGHTSEFYDQPVIENGEVRKEPMYLTKLWTNKAIDFIEANRDKPFFLYLAYNGPYGLGASLNNPARNRHADFYADKELPSFPRGPVHPWLFNNKQFINNPDAMRRYAAEVSGVDDGVGEVMAALKRLGLDENTLVIFMADQGLAGGHGGIWGMGDHTRPLTGFDSTIHIPLIFRHAERLPAGRRNENIVAIYDILPTVLDYLGMSDRMPSDPPRPGQGRSLVPLLRGEEVAWKDELFFEFENIRAIRTKRWKYIERFKQDPARELYDLEADPLEQNNLAFHNSPDTIKVQQDLAARLHTFFTRHAEPRYNLWTGGHSQTGLATHEIFNLPRNLKKRPK